MERSTRAIRGPTRPPRQRLARGAAALCALLGSAAPLSAQPAEERSYADGIVAVVEGQPITGHELELSCRLVGEYRSLSSDAARYRVRAKQLDLLIEERVLLIRAEADEVKLSPTDEARLQLELARAAEPFRGIEGLRLSLEQVGVPLDYFIDRKRTNLIISKLLLKNISRDIFITPAQIRRFYQEHRGRFEHRGETRLRQIVIYPDADDAYRVPPLAAAEVEAGTFDAQAFAETVREKALAGEPFEELARQASMGPRYDVEEVFPATTRLQDVLVPPLAATVEALEVGEVSPVVTSQRGTLHIILLTERREAGLLPLAEVQDEIEDQLKDEVWKSRLRTWIDQLKADAFIQKFLPPPH